MEIPSNISKLTRPVDFSEQVRLNARNQIPSAIESSEAAAKYKKYDSDLEDDYESSDTGSDVSLARAAGPNFADFARSLIFQSDDLSEANKYYYPYGSTINAPATDNKQFGKSKFETARKDITSMFLIDSRNRDKNAFPQPTSFTLKPPRVYKNVVSIQVTQIKLLSSFFYFRAAKANTFFPVIERGREAINTHLEHPLTEAVIIPEGTYNISDLLTSLQNQMNYTPLFYDYPNGFSDFVNVFTTNGDLGVNFNEPGDSYYDALNDKYVPNPTKDAIIKYYWGSRYTGLTQYSVDQVKVAYYYPVIYEALLDKKDKEVVPNLNLSVPDDILGEGETVYTHIIFNSSGINDPVVLYLINTNLSLLDTYRVNHTFRFYLVNRYQLAYDTNSLRVNIISLTLNTSLLNLFTLTNSVNLANALQTLNVSATSFSNTSNTLNRAKVIFNDMYTYIQTQLTKYFAIGYATYAAEYFLTPSNILYIQDGFGATGVRTGYTAEYLTSGISPISSLNIIQSNSPGYWPKFNVTTTNGGLYGGGIDPSGMNVSTSMIPYNVQASNFQFGTSIIDDNKYYIATNKSSRSVNSVITIKPAKYTVFKFRSPSRQTLQVETLPLPYYYRFADYNKAGLYKGVLDASNNNIPQKYFDLSYAFVYNTTGASPNNLMDSSNYSSFTLTETGFGQSLTTALTNTPSLSLTVQRSALQFEFTAPYPPGITTGLVLYNTSLSFTSVDSNSLSTLWSDSVNSYLYHDRAAFMADIQFTRLENSNHYIQSASAGPSNSDITFNFSTFAGHKYYSIFRSENLGFQSMLFKPIIYYKNANYTQIQTNYNAFSPTDNPYKASNIMNYPFVINYNTDFLRLPVQSSLQEIDPSNTVYTNLVAVQSKPIGYDISRVSNDLTDYEGYIPGRQGFVPNSGFRIDPFSKYTFQALTAFDSNANTYFGTGSKNNILQPVTNRVYSFKGTSSSQLKIVHWYDGHSIPQQIQDNFTSSNAISSPMTSSLLDFVPGTNNTIVQGYPTDSNGNVLFGQGINAIGFLPTDGVYDISSFAFKSALYPIDNISTTSEDPNTDIKYIGVFQGSYLATKSVEVSTALTVLKFSKSYVYNISTLSNTPGFGVQGGTWYEFGYDPSFVAPEDVGIAGYTQGSNELLSYDSMYYMVPFNSNGSNITYSRLTGSVLPYPLAQQISTGPTYFGQTTRSVAGAPPQRGYVIPSTSGNAIYAYGPNSTLSAYTQSQYEQSQPITTTSIGYREYGFLVQNAGALFPFATTFKNSVSTISTGYIGINTAFSEYNNNLYIVNSLNYSTNISNDTHSFKGAKYASSLNTIISSGNGTLSSIHYLANPPSTLQGYTFSATGTQYSSFVYQDQAGTDDNITVRKYQFDPAGNNATIWLWGGGGAGNQGIGGAGAYAKAVINIPQLLNIKTPNAPLGISTVYLVVGRGGDIAATTTNSSNTGQVQNYEQLRYGGGGTSFYIDCNSGYNFEARGGGFSGLFTGSNLLDTVNSIPLIIVGGGGAGGNAPASLGGPGGFGGSIGLLPDIHLQFSSAIFTDTYLPDIIIKSLRDIDQNIYNVPASYIATSNTLPNLIDGNLTTTWNPISKPYLNPTNFYPTVNTWRINIEFNSIISSINTFRIYGSPQGDIARRPTGLILYNNQNRSQVLYSNTTNISNIIKYIPNQSYLQEVYDLPVVTTIYNSTLVTNGWVILTQYFGGTSPPGVQYSLDTITWSPGTYSGEGYDGMINIIYVGAPINMWIAAGAYSAGIQAVNYEGSAGQFLNATPVITGTFTGGSVAVNGFGNIQLACGTTGVWISSNYGSTFSKIPTISTSASCSAISATGEYIIISLNNILNISSNYGSTWVQNTSITGAWLSLGISASGKYIIVNTSSAVYISSNNGLNWLLSTTIPSSTYNTVAISSSGKYILVTSSAGLYISNNYGSTFSLTSVTGLLYASAISSSEQYMIAGIYNGRLYISNNYGVSWTQTTNPIANPWLSLTISSTGLHITAGTTSTLYISYNKGVFWYKRTTISGNFSSVSMSGNAQYQLALTDTGVYSSVAPITSSVGSAIRYSRDGLNFQAANITECGFNGSYNFFTLLYINSLGLILASGYGTSGRPMIMVSIDGINWSYTGISGLPIQASGNASDANKIVNMRYINSTIWALGRIDALNSGVFRSIDGFTWAPVSPTITSIAYDIAYGAGKYVIACERSVGPYFSAFIYSINTTTWIAANSTNITGFIPFRITFGNSVFVAVGYDTTCYIRYSTDGINWLIPSFPTGVLAAMAGDYSPSIKFNNGLFIAMINTTTITDRAQNQISVLTSVNGINWSPILSGGANFNASAVQGSRVYDVAYGQLSIQPNLSTVYLEIQKSTTNPPSFSEFHVFAPPTQITPTNISTSISSIIDNNLSTLFWPDDTQTKYTNSYSMILNFSNVVSSINKIQFYVPTGLSNSPFTGVTIQTAATSNIVYQNNNVINNDFLNLPSYALYQTNIIPPVSTVSSLFITFNKTSYSSLQMYEVKALYDQNAQITQIKPISIIDLNRRGGNLNNTFDGNLSTFWIPGTYARGSTLALNYTFSTILSNANHMQILNGTTLNTSSLIDKILVYSDSNKTNLLYSNSAPVYNQFSFYNMFDFNITPPVRSKTLYVELTKNTSGSPVINEIRFYSIGGDATSSAGFTGGTLATMQQGAIPVSPYDGGGGSNSLGGRGADATPSIGSTLDQEYNSSRIYSQAVDTGQNLINTLLPNLKAYLNGDVTTVLNFFINYTYPFNFSRRNYIDSSMSGFANNTNIDYVNNVIGNITDAANPSGLLYSRYYSAINTGNSVIATSALSSIKGTVGILDNINSVVNFILGQGVGIFTPALYYVENNLARDYISPDRTSINYNFTANIPTLLNRIPTIISNIDVIIADLINNPFITLTNAIVVDYNADPTGINPYNYPNEQFYTNISLSATWIEIPTLNTLNIPNYFNSLNSANFLNGNTIPNLPTTTNGPSHTNTLNIRNTSTLLTYLNSTTILNSSSIPNYINIYDNITTDYVALNSTHTTKLYSKPTDGSPTDFIYYTDNISKTLTNDRYYFILNSTISTTALQYRTTNNIPTAFAYYLPDGTLTNFARHANNTTGMDELYYFVDNTNALIPTNFRYLSALAVPTDYEYSLTNGGATSFLYTNAIGTGTDSLLGDNNGVDTTLPYLDTNGVPTDLLYSDGNGNATNSRYYIQSTGDSTDYLYATAASQGTNELYETAGGEPTNLRYTDSYGNATDLQFTSVNGTPTNLPYSDNDGSPSTKMFLDGNNSVTEYGYSDSNGNGTPFMYSDYNGVATDNEYSPPHWDTTTPSIGNAYGYYTNIIKDKIIATGVYSLMSSINLMIGALDGYNSLSNNFSLYNTVPNKMNSITPSPNIGPWSSYSRYVQWINYNIIPVSPTKALYTTLNNFMTNIINNLVSDQYSIYTKPSSGGLTGSYLRGGSPGAVTIYPTNEFQNITDYLNSGGGGGGGGYYGGGGGSSNSGGGGGGGFVYSSDVFSILDYGTAVVNSNYATPGAYELTPLLNNSLIPASTRLNNYAQGGSGTSGAHGLIIFTFESPVTVAASNRQTAIPNYIDGSRLSLFTAPVTYELERTIKFVNYADSIETTSYAGFNWVWYRSYLLLTGNTLLTNMKPSSSTPTLPSATFPHLPGIVYSILANSFSTVSTFYAGSKTSGAISSITNGITFAFNIFQTSFIEVPYTDPSYIEMTEIYGLLDYLQDPNNLARPHLDPQNPQLDRIFGGVPRFGYWANPFLTNASYVGFDVGPSLYATSPLSTLTGNNKPVTAMYGLVMEQSLSTGIYQFKDLMAYKPTVSEAALYGSNWLTVTQMPEAYITRSLTARNTSSNIPVQPYTMKNAINGRFPLLNYKVFTTPVKVGLTYFNTPIHMINDFESVNSYIYTFQNIAVDNVSSLTLTTVAMTSTTININQRNVTDLSNFATDIIGTAVSEFPLSTYTQAVSQFGFNKTITNDFTPVLGLTNAGYYNSYTPLSAISSVNVGKAINDYNGNFYVADNTGGSNLYENICTFKVYHTPFLNTSYNYASPGYILGQYLRNNKNPMFDYLVSKYENIWHVQGTQNLSTIYGARLGTAFDFIITTNFLNQTFYPTHKIVLTRKTTSLNPITDITDITDYPSYPKTAMFFYTNYSSMVADISGQFALEKSNNFTNSDITSGYFFNSYINNIGLTKSVNYANSDPNSFNYLAIRAYSPSETFKSLVRFYLPGRYDFGYISLTDLSNEIYTVQTDTNTNPQYKKILGLYHSSFALSKTFGGSGLPGFSGSNISSINFGGFLSQFIKINSTINATSVLVSTVNGSLQNGIINLINGDLKNILPPNVATRERITDPLEFMLPLSTVAADSNRKIDEYGLGFNLGFNYADTKFATSQKADSFFKILDDYIYLKMNPEYNMNRLDIAGKEDLAATMDSMAQQNLYNCKLILNNFGTFATTFVQNPVSFNPVIGKLDKLTFAWYDVTGQIINNNECEWSGALQIVEKMDIATDDSTVPKSG